MEEKKVKDRLLFVWQTVESKIKKILSNNNTFVFMICLMVSILFWVLKALSEDYRTEVEFPIEYARIPDNYALYGERPNELVATIEDAGYAIIRYRFAYVFSSLKIDVSGYFQENDSIVRDGKITLSQQVLKKGIEHELINTSKIISVFPEDVVLNYSRLEERNLPIKVLAEITTEQQHIVNGAIRTNPDSVMVIGSSSLLEKTKYVMTTPIRVNNVKDSVVRTVSLQSPEGLKLNRKRVKLIIPVETYTEKIVEVPIQGRDFPDSLQIRTFPGVAKVSCICGLSVFSQVHPYDFVCYIDYKSVKDKSIGQVEVKVENNSEYAQRVMLKTQTFDYLIEKK